MAKFCENCGKKSGFVSGDPLLLNSDKILCSKCAIHIKEKVDELYSTKDENKFIKLKDEILSISKEMYNALVFDELKGLIDRIAQRKDFNLKRDMKEKENQTNIDAEKPYAVESDSSSMKKRAIDNLNINDISILKVQNEQLETLKSIESMIKFFVVITIISISVSVISFLIMLSNL